MIGPAITPPAPASAAPRQNTNVKSFETTVVTPRKCPGRERPQSLSLMPSTVT